MTHCLKKTQLLLTGTKFERFDCERAMYVAVQEILEFEIKSSSFFLKLPMKAEGGTKSLT